MSDTSSPVPPTGSPDQAAGAQAQGPVLQTLAQYLKDLSFENPSPLDTLTQPPNNPSVNVNVGVDTRHVRDVMHEVTVTVRVETKSGERTLFLIEMTYCGLFATVNIPAENVQPILRVHCATLLFPFIRQIVADATRDGGFAPLYLNMIDFAQMYQQDAARNGQADVATNGGAATA